MEGVPSRGINPVGIGLKIGVIGSEKLGQSKLLAVVADFQCLEWDQTLQSFSLLQRNIPLPVGDINLC